MNLEGMHPRVCTTESMIRMHTQDAKVPIPVLIIS